VICPKKPTPTRTLIPNPTVSPTFEPLIEDIDLYPTTFHRARTLEEASELYARLDNASFLSGGHTLVPTMKQGLASPAHLIDLTSIASLTGIERQDQVLVIGAATRHVSVASSETVQNAIPALAALAGSIGDRQVRFRGTIGGSVANNDPAADYPAALMGLGATVVTNQRSLSAEAYFVGLFQTALEPGEVVVEVRFPIPMAGGYAKFRGAAARYSVVGVWVSQTQEGVRVAITGAGDQGVFRHLGLERALTHNFSATVIQEVVVEDSGLLSDLNASAAYRANLIKVLCRHATQNMGCVVNLK